MMVIMSNIAKYVLLFICLAVSFSFAYSVPDSTTLMVKVIDVNFVEDLYEDGTFEAWEEIECETMSEGKIKKIKIINNISDRELKIEKNQVLLITIKRIDAMSETDFVLTEDMILHLEVLRQCPSIHIKN